MENQPDNNIKIGDILRACVARWYFFVISIAVCLAFGALVVLRTSPVFQRSATILIKEQIVRKTTNNDLESMLSASGAGGSSSKLVNEVIAFKSPALMGEVVSRLGLDTEYSVKGTFHSSVVYGTSVPVNVVFCENPTNVSMSFQVSPQTDSTFSVSRLSYFDAGINETVKDKKFNVSASFGDTLSLGGTRVAVLKSEIFSGKWEKPVFVQRRSMYSATRLFSSKFDATQNDTKNHSDVLTLQMQDVNIHRADDVINMLINIYNENWVDDKNKMAISTSMFIRDRLDTIEKELGNVDESISDYKSKNMIPDVASVSNMYMTQSTETAREMQGLENQLYVSRFVRNYLTNGGGNNDLIPMASSIENAGISAQIAEYNRLVLNRNNIVANSSEQNPLAVDYAAALASMRSAIVEAIDNQVATLEAQAAALRKVDEKTSQKIAASPTQAKYLLSVERQQKVKEALYLFLLQKREENELSQAFTAYNTRVITPPTGSNLPIEPKSRQIMLVAFLLGLCIPMGYLYLREMLNTKVRGRKDLEDITLPLLGEVPRYVSREDRNKKKTLIGKLKFWDKPKDKSIVVVKEGKRDVINEAFRVLRTNIEFMTKGSGKTDVTIITSFNPGSGKTFLCMNTAVAIAIKGQKVLCIDGDLRHASLSQFVDSPKVGLSDYLAGKTDNLNDLIVHSEKHYALDILPVGTIPPNPSELIGLEKFDKAVEALKSEYDYVFIDCPPIDIVADTQIIAKNADRTIFIVRAGLLERTMLPELQKIYNEKKYPNMSMILNGTESNDGKYAYRYGYRYGYHYGHYGDHVGYYGSEEE